jgi:hypothetical protein
MILIKLIVYFLVLLTITKGEKLIWVLKVDLIEKRNKLLINIVAKCIVFTFHALLQVRFCT